jgi:hypothetical protein
MRFVFFASFVICLLVPSSAVAQGPASLQSDQLTANFLKTVTPQTLHPSRNADGGGVLGRQSSGNTLGVDSVANWTSYFYESAQGAQYAIAPGYFQFAFPYTMVGHAPFGQGNEQDWNGEITRINAPIVPVSLDLRNADGSPRYVNGQRLYYDATQYVAPVLASPVFSNDEYDSSEMPTQFTDALMRAEFFHKADPEWHTILRPRVVTPRTMVLIRGTYRFALNSDGSCCLFVLVDYNTFGNALFPTIPTDTTTPVGAAENAGEVRTKDISTFLFPNTYLYFNGDPTQCCVLGYHTYDLEPGDRTNGFQERRYVLNYSSWITNGLFKGFADITALSHELSETFNDPFGGNATPWWLSPNGNCQNNLETGDVIEGLPNAIYPIQLNGATWSPQNEALLQWFAGIQNSNAIHHAYSYPDITVLTAPAVPQNPGCTPPII